MWSWKLGKLWPIHPWTAWNTQVHAYNKRSIPHGGAKEEPAIKIVVFWLKGSGFQDFRKASDIGIVQFKQFLTPIADWFYWLIDGYWWVYHRSIKQPKENADSMAEVAINLAMGQLATANLQKKTYAPKTILMPRYLMPTLFLSWKGTKRFRVKNNLRKWLVRSHPEQLCLDDPRSQQLVMWACELPTGNGRLIGLKFKPVPKQFCVHMD